jgi:hypothetical protein
MQTGGSDRRQDIPSPHGVLGHDVANGQTQPCWAVLPTTTARGVGCTTGSRDSTVVGHVWAAGACVGHRSSSRP